MKKRREREGNVKCSQALSLDYEQNEFLHDLVDVLDGSCHEGFALNKMHNGESSRVPNSQLLSPDDNLWEGGVCSFSCVALTPEAVIFQTMQYKFDCIKRGETGFC